MNAPLYLFNCFLSRLRQFVFHWYFNSFRIYSHFIVSLFEKIDRKIALKITWLHLFQPLYQDRTIFGYILGFIFRNIRLLIGVIIYSIIAIFAIIIYLIWALIPIFIIYKTIKNV